jgi:uncharacterized membrane protein YidH (DUF202 family)
MTRLNRPLTLGEVAIARSVFGDAIDYAKVRLIKGKWWPFQPRRSAMAPMGDIYFHPDGGGWSDDFSREPVARQGFFIHELTHVWQAQAKGKFYLPLMRHPFCHYRYGFEPGKPFERYGLEQQAEIVRHAFLLQRGAAAAAPAPLAALQRLLPFGAWTNASGHSRVGDPMDADQESFAELRTDFSEDRTVLANERTFASWMRTGLACIGIGLGFHALFNRLEPPWVPKGIATAFLLIAIFIFIAAERRSCDVLRRLHQHRVKSLGRSRMQAIAVVSVIAALALVAAIWLLPLAPPQR